jgi:4-amino-4-deoxy-L-arabinose transferase-like glycosyltransferase
MNPRRWATLAWSAARLLIVGFAGWLWFFSTDRSALRDASLAAVLVLAVVAGVVWYFSRSRADRRWRAALDRYAELEQAKRTFSRRNPHARPQPQAR